MAMIAVVAAILFATAAAADARSQAAAAARQSEQEEENKKDEAMMRGSSAAVPPVEGFQMKFPSVKDIARPIIGKITEIPKSVSKTAKATTKQVGKRVKAVEKKLSGIMRVVDKKITGGFKTIFTALATAVTFLTNIPGCLIYYMLDALGWAMYAPIAFFVWVFSLQALERALWRYVDIIDGWTHRATGVHPFHFSANVRNKCYFANIREPPRAAAANDDGDDGDEAAGQQSNDAQLMGTIAFSVLCLALAWSAVMAN